MAPPGLVLQIVLHAGLCNPAIKLRHANFVLCFAQPGEVLHQTFLEAKNCGLSAGCSASGRMAGSPEQHQGETLTWLGVHQC